MADIEDVIAEFEAKLKAVVSGEAPVVKGEASVTEVEHEPELTGEGVACIAKSFKELVDVLPSLYVGMNIKDDLVELLKTYPECEG
ncbi:hypothetical protein LCGC14_1676120 [marine sediment metagenome]|uniref:Uncharacterized protein n=1 Tax=marine sediment metagenome TaxID=412755 RepID=A0A0F9HPZ9_9ZZZZ